MCQLKHFSTEFSVALFMWFGISQFELLSRLYMLYAVNMLYVTFISCVFCILKSVIWNSCFYYLWWGFLFHRSYDHIVKMHLLFSKKSALLRWPSPKYSYLKLGIVYLLLHSIRLTWNFRPVRICMQCHLWCIILFFLSRVKIFLWFSYS